MGLFQKIFGDLNSKELKKLDRIADQVGRGNLLENDHVLIDVDQDGKYTCHVEKPLSIDFDALLQ